MVNIFWREHLTALDLPGLEETLNLRGTTAGVLQELLLWVLLRPLVSPRKGFIEEAIKVVKGLVVEDAGHGVVERICLWFWLW